MNWTFGIPTFNNENGFLNTIINSIEALKIPQYEILIIGNCDIQRDNTKIIPFNEHIKNGWISHKKNLLSHLAKFENLCIFHDYMVFDPQWYNEFVKFGDNWDVCMNQLINADGIRFRDWLTWDSDNIIMYPNTILQLDYADHSHLNRMYVSGSYFCAKKSFLLQNPFDETRGWGQGEDVEWSLRVRSFWNYRCNPASIVRFLKHKWHDPQHRRLYDSLHR